MKKLVILFIITLFMVSCAAPQLYPVYQKKRSLMLLENSEKYAQPHKNIKYSKKEYDLFIKQNTIKNKYKK